jgi:hypothetical protein
VREEVVGGNHGGMTSTLASELAKTPCPLYGSLPDSGKNPRILIFSLLVEMFARWLPYLLGVV